MVTRYGTAELFGYNFSGLTPQKIREYSAAHYKEIACPFKSIVPGNPTPTCSKKGGVCSLRQYSRDADGTVAPIGPPVTTCPQRFLEQNLVFEWVGEILLRNPLPLVISEVPFLMGETESHEEEADAVGMIDKVLVSVSGQSLKWCALEMQAVYFSGKSMENDFKDMRHWEGPGIPFPKVQRRPDFRSSGPKRLMPQLQIKVPTISRWGKKMAVVVDKAFWGSLGEMREVRDLSNSEIVWFVVSYGRPVRGRFSLERHQVHFTTLSHAVEGLTGGTPVSLENFEHEIRARMPQT